MHAGLVSHGVSESRKSPIIIYIESRHRPFCSLLVLLPPSKSELAPSNHTCLGDESHLAYVDSHLFMS